MALHGLTKVGVHKLEEIGGRMRSGSCSRRRGRRRGRRRRRRSLSGGHSRDSGQESSLIHGWITDAGQEQRALLEEELADVVVGLVGAGRIVEYGRVVLEASSAKAHQALGAQCVRVQQTTPLEEGGRAVWDRRQTRLELSLGQVEQSSIFIAVTKLCLQAPHDRGGESHNVHVFHLALEAEHICLHELETVVEQLLKHAGS
mmetsp:Transcript_13373/g.40373  ORF Transcript_13373/g.40373 Transcript_13373/m.40373 type:complete len:202 (+) Transcript_13373:1128-1733(+)